MGMKKDLERLKEEIQIIKGEQRKLRRDLSRQLDNIRGNVSDFKIDVTKNLYDFSDYLKEQSKKISELQEKEPERCNWCGGLIEYQKTYFGENKTGYKVVCDSCGFQGPIGLTNQQAKSAWNKINESIKNES